MRRVPSFAALMLILVSPVLGQTTSGSIVGAVTDPTGASVTGASITITNIDTAGTFKTASDSSGNYVASPLSVGRYSVAVEAQGFKTAVSSNIAVNVQDRVHLDFKLEVGALTQSIHVADAAPLLQSDTSNLSQVVDNQRADELPLNGRFVTKLAVLTAGVLPTTSFAPDSRTGGFSANGLRPFQNDYILDGIDNNNMQAGMTSGASYVITPPPDAIGEFRLQTNTMSAEFGHSGGAVMNVTLKSGTNEVHGALFEFLRNSAMDAKNFFDSPTNPIPPFKQNQFGGTAGGPVYIPHVYNGKNKTFFFVDYQGTRIRQGLTLLGTVPPGSWQNGNFSGFNTIFDPTTTTVVNGVATRRSFPGNQIPISRFDPVAQKLIKEFPAPNLPGSVNSFGVANNYLSSPSKQDDVDQFDVRIDHRISDSDSIFARFSYSDENILNPSAIPPPLSDGAFMSGTIVTSVRTGAVAYTHLFTPRTINEFRTGYIYNNTALRGFNPNTDAVGQLGIPGIPYIPGNGGLPTFYVAGINSFGGGQFQPTIEITNEFQLVDDLTLVRGSHTLKIGGEARPRVNIDFLQPIAPRGVFSFSGNFTRDPNNISSTGLGTADFLLGNLTFATITSSENDVFQQPGYGLFVQDDYKVNSKFTVNLGLRYEFVSNAMEKYNAQASFNLATDTLDIVKGRNDALPANFDYNHIPVNRNASRTLVPNHYLHFAPRVGLAYRVLPKTVIRSGYGIFYSSYETGPLSDPNQGLNPPFHRQSIFNAPSLVTLNPIVGQLSHGFPADALSNPVAPSFFALDPHFRNPYTQVWNFAIQRELAENLVFEAAYAGSKGTALYAWRNANQAKATADPTIPLDVRRPLPYLGQGLTLWCSCASSTYHSLQTKLEKRFSGGLSLLAAYTFGKSIDEQSAIWNAISPNEGYRDATHPEWEKGLTNYDVKHRFVFSYSYDLPVGRGKRLGANMSRVADAILGGWEFVGIDSFQTGFPFTVTSVANFANSDGQTRPDRVVGVSLIPANQGPSEWFNPAAFQPAVPGTYGNAGRDILEGPGQINVDFSVFKNFRLGEHRTLQFRGELFNVLNHPNFQGSSIQLSNDAGGAGQITAANPSRQIQLALKLYY